jgi:hypothetical protein
MYATCTETLHKQYNMEVTVQHDESVNIKSRVSKQVTRSVTLETFLLGFLDP